MASDLQLVGLKYNIASAVFFVGIWFSSPEILDLNLIRYSLDTLWASRSTIVRNLSPKIRVFNDKFNLIEILL
jgi:hypothetical protein